MTSVTSILYGVYLVITVLLYWLLPPTWRRYFLLGASLIFLGLASWQLLSIVVTLSVFVYWLGRFIYGGARNRGFFLLGILVPTGLLAYYKYAPWIMAGFNALAKDFQYPPVFSVPHLLVPIGISFFTFKLLHYLIICYRGEAKIGGFGHFLLYISFFPIFTSGPIERWPHFQEQQPRFSPKFLYTGGARIIIGLLKKKVLADNLLVFANMLGVPGLSSGGYWLAAYAYALQIYLDFSGYSDIAIGSARLFGYDIAENFNWPYLQRNISLFWKNWHMTLTSWFTHYIFIPLGGSRVTLWRIIFNTMVVMATTGLWHGAAWHFMFWGLYHGIGLTVWRIYGLLVGNKLEERWGKEPLLTVASVLLTFHFVVIGWVFFATNFQQGLHVVAKMLLIK